MGAAKLIVEGIDDKWSIINLLVRHGIDYDTKPWPSNFPSIDADEPSEIALSADHSGGVEKLLNRVFNFIRLAGGSPIGFVLDADSPLQNRWMAIKNRLQKAGAVTPEMPLPEGFIGFSEAYQTKVGVWLMPDNQSDGRLETFLHSLIDENDFLIDHAISAAKEA